MNLIKIFFTDFFYLYSNNHKFFFEIIILFSISLLLKIYYPNFRGLMGEFWVKIELNKLPKNEYIVLNDIMIYDNNRTHQIDHIVISNYGIFVIEMKNYYGLIKGNKYDNKWYQYLGRTRNNFLNPIHQNYGHIKSLANLLKLDEKYFISIICFSNQADLKVNCKDDITHLDFLKNKILKFKDINYTYDINELANIIKNNNIVDRKMRRKHIKDIHTKIKNDNELVNKMICPKCGNQLVKKTGKYGTFIGCSNFPKCKYTKK